MTGQAPMVVLATGGTGGHMYPAEAPAAEFSGRGCRPAVGADRRGGRRPAAGRGGGGEG